MKRVGMVVFLFFFAWAFIIWFAIYPRDQTYTSQPTAASTAFSLPTPIPTQTPIPLPDLCASDQAYQLDIISLSERQRTTDYRVEVSPDGRYEAYWNQDGLFVRTVDHTVTMPLASGDGIRWSPTGNWLAYVSGENYYNQALDIVVYDVQAGLFPDRKIVLNARLNHPGDLVGWSPDGRYLYTIAGDDLAVWSVDQQTIIFHSVKEQTWIDEAVWSPNAGYLAYSWREACCELQISLAALDGSAELVFDRPDQVPPEYLFWSPDSRYVLVINQSPTNMRLTLTLLGLDGREIELTHNLHVWRSDPRTFAPSQLPPDRTWYNERFYSYRWQGTTLLFWEELGSQNYRLNLWNGGETAQTLLITPRPPFFPLDQPQSGRTAIYYEEDGQYHIDLMDADGTNRVPFIAHADDAGNPDWSPDGTRLAATWAEGEGDERRVKLSWIDADGANYHELDQGYADIRDLNWSPYTDELAFTSNQGKGYQVEIVDLITAERTVLNEPSRNLYTTYWCGSDGLEDCQGLFLLRAEAVQISRPVLSPDGLYAAFKTRRAYFSCHEELYLARADGSEPRRLRSRLCGLGDPVWSPDSQSIAFTQNKDKQVTMEVVTISGETVMSAPFTFPLWGTVTEWRACNGVTPE